MTAKVVPILRGNSILDYMCANGIPLTRENYVDLSGMDEPLYAEEEASLPPFFQDWRLHDPNVFCWLMDW